MAKLKKRRASAAAPELKASSAESTEKRARQDPPVRAKRKLARRKEVVPPTDAQDEAKAPVADLAEEPEQKLFRTNTSFSKLGLAKWIVDTCGKLGMNYPTDIQAMAIPPVLSGKNIAGNARTGSGKTACYSLPILHFLSKDPYGIFALILVPVRELAFQVADNFRAMGQAIHVSVGEIVGGRDFSIQSRLIADRTHVLVATPGRLADLLRGDFALARAFRKLHTFVLDEADQLLTETFEDPLSRILEVLPESRQTLFFSATITECIERLRKGKDLMLVDANPNEETLQNLTQLYVFVPKSVQVNYLHFLLKSHFPDESCIIFAQTIEECQMYTTMLDILGFAVTGLHSLQSQRQRLASLGKFRASRASILLATDVASRGLDIPMVGVVINVGLPFDPASYVHRAGRTARAGRPGKVVSLMSELDVPRVQGIEKRIGKQLQLLPTKEEEAIKLLSRTTKAYQRAELLLSEVGFTDQVAEHRGAQHASKKSRKLPKAKPSRKKLATS